MSTEGAPRYLLAEEGPAEVAAVLERMEGSDWAHTRPAEEIATAVGLTQARLRMADLRRDRRPARWFAKVVSFAYLRRPPGMRDAYDTSHLIFEVEVTEGAKTALGRKVEVRVSLDEAERFGAQLLGMARACRKLDQQRKE